MVDRAGEPEAKFWERVKDRSMLVLTQAPKERPDLLFVVSALAVLVCLLYLLAYYLGV